MLHIEEAVLEAQLGHSVKDQLGTAYNRAQFIQRRVKVMQQWADYLDELADGSKADLLKQAA